MVTPVAKNAFNVLNPPAYRQQFKTGLIALGDTKIGGTTNSQGQLSSLAEMRALLNRCYKLKPVTYREYANSVKSPAKFNPAGVYVQFQSGSHQGEIADFSSAKNIMSYLSPTDKVYLMDYGFREMGLQQIHMRDDKGRILSTVTLNEFRKINGAYEDALKDSGGSNTPAMRQALKDLNALGEKLYPASKAISVKPKIKPRMNLEEFSPWLQDQIRNHGMTIEDAKAITKRSKEAKYVDAETGRRIGCYTTGFVDQKLPKKRDKNTFWLINDIKIETNGFKEGVGGASQTRTVESVRDSYSGKNISFQDTGLVYGKSKINLASTRVVDAKPVSKKNVSLFLKSVWRNTFSTQERAFPIQTFGMCVFPDGSKMKASNDVRIHYPVKGED